MKEAGLLPDTPALSKLVAAASKVHSVSSKISVLSVFLAVFGLAVFGGMYLEIPAVIIALYARHKGEGKAARTALLISLACLVGTAFFSFIRSFF
jgi:hypothetical protein